MSYIIVFPPEKFKHYEERKEAILKQRLAID